MSKPVSPMGTFFSPSLAEEAEKLKWGPTVNKPQNINDALEYIADVWGTARRDQTLGEVYTFKCLQWIIEQHKIETE